jgi:hypothetical protein
LEDGFMELKPKKLMNQIQRVIQNLNETENCFLFAAWGEMTKSFKSFCQLYLLNEDNFLMYYLTEYLKRKLDLQYIFISQKN